MQAPAYSGTPPSLQRSVSSMPEKVPAILLIAYGSCNAVGLAALRRFEERVRMRFPGRTVRWAYTSEHIRTRLASQVRAKSDSVTKALKRLILERFCPIAAASDSAGHGKCPGGKTGRCRGRRKRRSHKRRNTAPDDGKGHEGLRQGCILHDSTGKKRGGVRRTYGAWHPVHQGPGAI